MTLSEYMSAENFPVTSRQGLSVDQQLMIDAFNYDQLKEYEEGGGKLSDRQVQIKAELSRKIPSQSAIRKELQQTKSAPNT